MLTAAGQVLRDRLATWSEAPGYRDLTLIVDIDRGDRIERLELNFSKEDALAIAYRILAASDLAWDGHDPIDVEPGEQRPAWVLPHGVRTPLHHQFHQLVF